MKLSRPPSLALNLTDAEAGVPAPTRPSSQSSPARCSHSDTRDVSLGTPAGSKSAPGFRVRGARSPRRRRIVLSSPRWASPLLQQSGQLATAAPFWRSRLVLLVLTPTTVVTIGLVVGLGVGLGVGLHKDVAATAAAASTVAAASAGAAPSSDPTIIIIAGAVYTLVGVLPDHLANETVATALSISVVQTHISTNVDAVAQAVAMQAAMQADPNAINNLFVAWSVSMNKTYITVNQSIAGLAAFTVSVNSMITTNVNATTGAFAGLNGYSAMSAVEFTSTFLRPDSSRAHAKKHHNHTSNSTAARHLSRSIPPDRVYWPSLVANTGLKNQEQCGSCWANAGITVLEYAIAVQYPNWKPTPFSRQVMIDCANSKHGAYTSNGCEGGQAADVFAFAAQYTVPEERLYPYTSHAQNQGMGTGVCDEAKLTRPLIRNDWLERAADSTTSYAEYAGDSITESQVIAAVAIQPVTFSFTAVQSWLFYRGGIYSAAGQNCDGFKTNHAMVIVGYDNVAKFWIIQNSWSGWGDNGFGKIAMTGTASGPCSMYVKLRTTAWRHPTP